MIPYGKQDISQSDIDAVIDVLKSDFLTQGPVVKNFEDAVSLRVGASHAVATNSATSALHIACLALGLKSGDFLWTVPNTFVASANCGLYCEANIDFVDIDSDTWNLSVEKLEEKLAKAKKENSLPKILIPVHFSGQPTQQEEIWKLSQEYGFNIIEDASHSIGASRNNEPAGSCRWSDATIFSFHPVKIITTGEGGMALTNNSELASKMLMLRSHGITRDIKLLENESEGAGWYYEQQELGFNYRMTAIQAALGISQLRRLDSFILRRTELANRYYEMLADLPVQQPKMENGNNSSWHLYVIYILDTEKIDRRQVYDAMRSANIGVNVHYMPVHLQPYYKRLGFKDGSLPVAEKHGRLALTLPLYPGLTNDDQNIVVSELKKALGC